MLKMSGDVTEWKNVGHAQDVRANIKKGTKKP